MNPKGSKFWRGQIPQWTVRTIFIMFLASLVDNLFCILDIAKQVHIQIFIPKFPIETFGKPICPRVARLGLQHSDSLVFYRFNTVLAASSGTADILRLPPLGPEADGSRYYLFGFQTVCVCQSRWYFTECLKYDFGSCKVCKEKWRNLAGIYLVEWPDWMLLLSVCNQLIIKVMTCDSWDCQPIRLRENTGTMVCCGKPGRSEVKDLSEFAEVRISRIVADAKRIKSDTNWKGRISNMSNFVNKIIYNTKSFNGRR